ncbi:MAG: CDP-glycerol glycerophosphotransferase family protein [Selenomonadaceae bacterium]|nr:CDP-glycerol glycerophosphotransferase family protein [Selenomonadaceae bacterium]
MDKKQDEVLYIIKRKIKAFITNLFCRCFYVFPLQKNKIVFTTFEGNGGYACQPRYIAEELLKRNHNYEIVWLVNNIDRQFPNGIHKVKNTIGNRLYHLTSAKVWIDNSRKAYGTAKRKDQLYIQTWHAMIEFKPVGKFRGKLFPKIAHLVSEYDSNLADYVISNSEWCTNIYPEMLLYNGDVLKTGSPRCDIFLDERKTAIYKRIRQDYNIPQEANIVMYAPTFRGGSQKVSRQVFVETPTLNFDKLLQSLKKKFGGDWYVFFRLHPQLAAQMKNMPLSEVAENIIDVSQADDMNELLAATDVLITDYSSAAFDAIIIPIPVFLYCNDLKDYESDRGKLMWNLRKLFFPLAETNDELAKNIQMFDLQKYLNDANKFNAENGVLEDGKASSRIADVIDNFINES